MTTVHRAPTACPVCDANLVTTRLGCHSCGTELVGAFGSCDFCALDAKDVDLLKVFLVSRGNMREVEKHLGVSYPTARLRFAQVLSKLGLNGADKLFLTGRTPVAINVATTGGGVSIIKATAAAARQPKNPKPAPPRPIIFQSCSRRNAPWISSSSTSSRALMPPVSLKVMSGAPLTVRGSAG